MKRFSITTTHIHGVNIIERNPIRDERGSFCRYFCEQEFREAGFITDSLQINHSRTLRAGTIRGMHFQQPPHAEVKYVSCLSGSIFDVVVDLRQGSPTFLQWYGIHLNADDNIGLIVPQGCAHGYQALTDNAEFLYLVSTPYEADSEGVVHALDPSLGIKWPFDMKILSDKDQSAAMITNSYTGINIEKS